MPSGKSGASSSSEFGQSPFALRWAHAASATRARRCPASVRRTLHTVRAIPAPSSSTARMRSRYVERGLVGSAAPARRTPQNLTSSSPISRERTRGAFPRMRSSTRLYQGRVGNRPSRMLLYPSIVPTHSARSLAGMVAIQSCRSSASSAARAATASRAFASRPIRRSWMPVDCAEVPKALRTGDTTLSAIVNCARIARSRVAGSRAANANAERTSRPSLPPTRQSRSPLESRRTPYTRWGFAHAASTRSRKGANVSRNAASSASCSGVVRSHHGSVSR